LSRRQSRGWSAFADHDDGCIVVDPKAEEADLKTVNRRNPKMVDDDNPMLTKEDFKRARPATEVLPALIGEKATNELFRGRGPRQTLGDHMPRPGK
jgi:hypothetical protein